MDIYQELVDKINGGEDEYLLKITWLEEKRSKSGKPMLVLSTKVHRDKNVESDVYPNSIKIFVLGNRAPHFKGDISEALQNTSLQFDFDSDSEKFNYDFKDFTNKYFIGKLIINNNFINIDSYKPFTESEPTKEVSDVLTDDEIPF